MTKRSFLFEGRVEEFKEKFKNKFNQDRIARITGMVPSKYLDWVGKNLDSINFDQNFSTLVQNLNDFEKYSSNLALTDLYSYKNIAELNDALEKYKNRSKRSYQETKGGNIVFDDGRFFIVNPLTYEASCYYGKGTKWCTAASTDDNFKRYNDDGKLFYVLDTTLPTSNPYYKVAILKKFDGETIYWDAKDDPIRKGWILDTEKLNEINSKIDSYMEDFFSDQLKIFRDEAKRKKEVERIERLRVQRIQERKIQESEERRMDNEWDLNNPNISEEGLKAHALLNYLEDQNEAEVRTPEENAKLVELKNQVEELTDQYNQAEDPDTDILDRISEIEDEIEEIEKKIDVYNIIPNGQFYDMTQFEVIGADIDGNEYAVGTTDELEESATEYVKQLVDDIGYDGFSKGFAESYIDEDQVADVARDDYYYDVSENPESYFDDSQRELSDSQIDRINYLKAKIKQTENFIENLENLKDDLEDEEEIEQYEEKISELQESVEEMNTEIEDTEEDPQGDFPEHLFDKKVEDLLEDVRDNPIWYINERGLEINDFVDGDAFVQGVIDSDGLGIVNGYDGSYDEYKVKDQYFAVMRIG